MNHFDLIAVLFVSFGLLVISALTGTFMGYPLLVSLVLFVIVLIRRGWRLRSLLQMGLTGAKQSVPVVSVLLLIGMITAVWMAAGTVPALVYYGTRLISSQLFILCAFLLTSAVSILMGTSFGAVGTLGIALMVMARGSGVEVNPVAGAIIAGAFVGDRCSPMSSSAHLVASITHTALYNNLQNMVRSGLWPLILSVMFYVILSILHPVQLTDHSLIDELPNAFNLSPVVLSPAVVILLLAMLRVEVKLAMLVSIGLGVAIAHHFQHDSFIALIRFTLLGYQLDTDAPLQAILIGGGLLPMVKATFIVLVSTAFAGIFAGSQALSFVDTWLSKIRTQRQLARATVVTAIFANLFGCTQTIAILLTGQVMRPHYQSYYQSYYQKFSASSVSDEQLALDLEDTAVVIAPLVPWNIAGLIPATILAVGPGFIPYTSYLLLLPLFSLFRNRLSAEGQLATAKPTLQ
ncbi:MAG: Na+/H+ antiporter NhaC family protein [Phormidesmis sp.]